MSFPLSQRPPAMLTKSRLAVALGFAVVVFFLFGYRHDVVPHLATVSVPRLPSLTRPTDFASRPKIAKVSMLYGDHPDPNYVRALRSHRLHNERYNYAMYVLEEDALTGFWNKPTYLLSLIMQELAKPPAERLQWLMWVDADLILVNPGIPLEIFLPPADLEDIHFIGGRDHNGLNTGTFFLRVSQWSVHMLTKTLALPLNHPEIDLGNSMDQVAMSRIMGEDDGREEAAAKHPKNSKGEPESEEERSDRLARASAPYVFQPREWHNAYEFDHGFEGGAASNGYLLVHFPGMEERRWKHMDQWLDDLDRNQAAFDVPANESVYAMKIPEYWRLTRESRALVRRANATINALEDRNGDEGRRLRSVADALEAPLTNTTLEMPPGTDMLVMMTEAITPMRAALPPPTPAEREEEDAIRRKADPELMRQRQLNGHYV